MGRGRCGWRQIPPGLGECQAPHIISTDTKQPSCTNESPKSTAAPITGPAATRRSGQGGWNSRSNVGGGGPPSKNQNQSSGWTSGPIPQISGGGGDTLEPSGWEEPSPQSISRKMEIDDGTSAWGDPTRYNSKNVNLWDKNSATPSQSHSQQAHHHPCSSNHLEGSRGCSTIGTQTLAALSGYVGGGSQAVDNGTAAWGQASDAAGWGDPDEPSKTPGWGNPSPNPGKPGTKSMESWGGKGEGSVSASRHPSWDDEDDGGGGSGTAPAPREAVPPSTLEAGSGGGDSWMNPVSRQFSNMGLLGDDPSDDKKMEGDKRGITDYNGEMRRGGRSGGGYRMPSSKDMGPVDMGPYGERIMAILQQQRQHQQGGVGGAAAGGGELKLSPLTGGGLSKQPMVDSLPHPGMGGPLSDLHAKTQGMYS
ncbi:hypothetical protein INR49_006989, partial [Caranx melampygus]